MRPSHTTRLTCNEQRALLWATRTVGSAELPDKRLAQRAIQILAQKALRPSDSIPQGADDPAAAKGTYRFLENERVDAEPLWQSFHEDTARALDNLSRVYVLYDTTALMFPNRPATEGLGTIKGPKCEALLMHSGLAVRPDGHVLGLLHNAVWARPPEEFGKAATRRERSFEEKESAKWSRGVAEATAWRDQHSPATRLVHIMDREGDVWEVLQELASSNDDVVIRCAQDRSVVGEHKRVRPHVAAQPVLKRLRVDVPRKQGQPARRAVVEARAAEVAVSAPQRGTACEPVCVRVVWVSEPAPPDGAEPLDWLLWTTLPVATAKDALAVVKAYKLRWRIEDFHLTLKSGCRIEDSQLKTAERIEILLTFCCAVAVRLLQLTHWARSEPDALCTEVLSDLEWRLLWSHHHRRRVPPGHPPPSIREAVLMLGRLGGHLGRKGDGLPGVRCLWKGWTRFQLLVEGYHIAP